MKRLAIGFALICLLPQPAFAKTHFNSKQKLLVDATATPQHRNLVLADMDGDGLKDFVAYTQDDTGFKISVGSTSWFPTLQADYDSHFDWTYPNEWIIPGYPDDSFTYVDRVFTGHFASTTKEWFCFRAKSRYQGGGDWYNKNIYCFEQIGTKLAVVSGYAAPDAWHPGDAEVVGDFDGDGLDELLTYDRSTGANVHVLEPNQLDPAGYVYSGFAPLIGFAPGSFSGWSWPGGLTFHAGNFDDYPGEGIRDDLLVVNDTTREANVYHARLLPTGETTFFMVDGPTVPLTAGPQEINVADADGDGFEDLIVHDTMNGANSFHSTSVPGFFGPLLPGVLESGQLPLFSAPTENHLFFGLAKNFPGEGGDTNTRDDAFVFIVPWNAYARDDARFCAPGDPQCMGGKKTYWWYWTIPMPDIRTALAMSYYDGP